MFEFINNLFKKLAKNKPAPQAPLMDEEMYRLMRLETLWPQQTKKEHGEVADLIRLGVHKRLNAYFEGKVRFGIELTGEEFAYYWTG
jgi:hypothetical protein